MSAKMNHEELVELLQEGKIGFLRFVMDRRMQMIIWSGAGHTVRILRMNRLSSMGTDGHRADGPSGNG